MTDGHRRTSRDKEAGARHDGVSRTTQSATGRSLKAQLQRGLGNQAVRELDLQEAGSPVVSHPSDRSEQEAARIATELSSRPDASTGSAHHSTFDTDERSTPPGSTEGPSLPADLTRAVEGRFNDDLSDVRIHTDSSANDVAESIDAEAFTVGNHIGFASGAFRPDSRTGRRVLSHELAHVLQHRGHAGMKTPTGMVHRQARGTSRETTENPRPTAEAAEERPSPAPQPVSGVWIGNENDFTTHRIYELHEPHGYQVDLPERRISITVETERVPWVALEEQIAEMWGYTIVRGPIQLAEFHLSNEQVQVETAHSILDLETGALVADVRAWALEDRYPEFERFSERYLIPATSADTGVPSGSYRNIGELEERLSLRYALVRTDTPTLEGEVFDRSVALESTDYAGLDAHGNRYEVWQNGDGSYLIYQFSDDLPGEHLQSHVRGSIPALASAVSESGLQVVKQNPVGQPTAMYVRGGEVAHEVREVDGGLEVDLSEEGHDTIRTGAPDIDALGFSLPDGYLVHDIVSGRYSRSKYGGLAGTLGPDRFEESEAPALEAVEVVTHTGDSEEKSAVEATDIREQWLHAIETAESVLDNTWEQYSNYRTQYNDSRVMATTAGVVEFFSRASFDPTEYYQARTHFNNARSAIVTHPINVEEAAHELHAGESMIADVQREYAEFMQQNIDTGEAIVDHLEDIEDASQSVIETIAKAKYGTYGGIVIGAVYQHMGQDAARQLTEGHLANLDNEQRQTAWAEVDWSENVGGVVRTSIQGILTDLINSGIGTGIDRFDGADESTLATVVEEYLKNLTGEIASEAAEAVEGIDPRSEGFETFLAALIDGAIAGLAEAASLDTFVDTFFDVVSEELDKPGWVTYERMGWGEEVQFGSADDLKLDDDIELDGEIIELISTLEDLFGTVIDDAIEKIEERR